MYAIYHLYLYQYQCSSPCMHLAKLHSTVFGFIMVLYIALFHTFLSCVHLFLLVYCLWLVTKWMMVQLVVRMLPSVCVRVRACMHACGCICLFVFTSVCQQKLPSVPSSRLAEPISVQHVNLDKGCYICTNTYHIFVARIILSDTWTFSTNNYGHVAFHFTSLLWYVIFSQPFNAVHCHGTDFVCVMESVEGNSMDDVRGAFKL
jgi:hypothetical protein